jgi:hypothetical protein
MEGKERMPERPTLAVIGLTVLAILPAIQMWLWVSSNWVPLPYWDEWHTPGSQFESWYRGTLTLREMFSQHNESRNFFPRLLYFTLLHFGGWDVRKEMRVVFFGVCALCLLLLHLLRRTPGSSAISTLVGWSIMTFLCFAPVQARNFLYGIEIETFFPGFALLVVAALNLSELNFPTKALANLALAFVATYTFANGMLLWVLAWPLPSPHERLRWRGRLPWIALYFVAGVLSVGAYFVNYHRPENHPEFASISSRLVDLAHYIILWSGNYFAGEFVGPFCLGIIVLIFFIGAVSCSLWTIWQTRDWRTFYPWLLLAAFASATVVITAVGRVGFGVHQALDNRYVAFSRFFYIALFGLFFAIYCARIRSAPAVIRTFFFTNLGWLLGFLAIFWGASCKPNRALLATHHWTRVHLLHTLEWIEAIPDNPEHVAILPFAEALRKRARFLEEHHAFHRPFAHGQLVSLVRQVPPSSDGSHGKIETAEVMNGGRLHLRGWAWLPEQHRAADFVIIGAEDGAGNYKPFTLLETGVARPDLRDQMQQRRVYRAGFDYEVSTANILPGSVSLKGWAINLRTQTASPLSSTLALMAHD